MSRWLASLLAFSVLAVAVCGCRAEAGSDPEPQEVEETIGIHFSHFDRDVVTVKAGEPLKILIDNRDPIAHEWIVGTAEVHERHRTGTEPYHDSVPTEVSVQAFSSRATVVEFDKPGDYLFICHLPGHEEYGMTGILRVE